MESKNISFNLKSLFEKGDLECGISFGCSNVEVVNILGESENFGKLGSKSMIYGYGNLDFIFRKNRLVMIVIALYRKFSEIYNIDGYTIDSNSTYSKINEILKKTSLNFTIRDDVTFGGQIGIEYISKNSIIRSQIIFESQSEIIDKIVVCLNDY